MRISKREKDALAADILITVLAFIGVWMHFVKYGLWMFQFYTLCSNMFCMIACAVCAVGIIIRGKTPEFALKLKYLSVCTLMVTFFVVVAILSPMIASAYPLNLFQAEVYMLTTEHMLYHHLLCPLLALFSLIFIDGKIGDDRKLMLLSLIFTLAYALVATVLNANGTLDGPYPFLKVNEQGVLMTAVWYSGILLMSYLISLGIYRLWLGTLKKRKKSI